MRFTVITPCFNAEHLIAETVESVLAQRSVREQRAELEYILVDGASTDSTVAVAQAVAAHYPDCEITIISEPDTGMYDALAKGLALATGDVCSYLNAGDLYSPHAFDLVMALFQQHSVQWITGLEITHNEQTQIVSCRLPFRFRRELFDCGLYLGRVLPFVQQESTFWAGALNRIVDLDILRQFALAGDYYLWYRFSQHTDLKIVSAHLGGFRMHSGQLSEDYNRYVAEVHRLTRSPRLVDRLMAYVDRLMWYMPVKIKKRFNPDGFYVYDHDSQAWV